MFTEHRIINDGKFDLKKHDPDEVGEWKNRKDKAKFRLLELHKELDVLQELLFAELKYWKTNKIQNCYPTLQ